MKQMVKSVIADVLIGVILTGLTVAASYFEWVPTRYLEYKAYDASPTFAKESPTRPS